MNGDWKESLEWMGNNSPDTGVDYFTIYDPETFQYPPQAYGVMSRWDYGHMITYIAKGSQMQTRSSRGLTGPTECSIFHGNIRGYQPIRFSITTGRDM